jgi:hypothetical protein
MSDIGVIMNVRLILACAAVGIAATAFGGTAASAEQAYPGSITFSADVVKARNAVDIFGTCDDPAFTAAPVHSSILDAPDLRPREESNGRKGLFSHAKVKGDAEPGIWQVDFMCGDQMVFGYLRVAGEEVAPDPPRIFLVQPEGKPGDKIWVGVYCETPAAPSSAAFTFTAMRSALEGHGLDLPLFDTHGTVKKVRPGQYKVSAKCGEKTISTKFTVLGTTQKPATGKAPVGLKETGDDTREGQTPVVAATETATATGQPSVTAAAAEAPDSGMGLGMLAAGGAAVLLASAGVGTWMYRRRRMT